MLRHKCTYSKLPAQDSMLQLLAETIKTLKKSNKLSQPASASPTAELQHPTRHSVKHMALKDNGSVAACGNWIFEQIAEQLKPEKDEVSDTRQ